MDELLDDASWAPPFLANHGTGSSSPVTIRDGWDGKTPNQLAALAHIPGFRAAYFIDAQMSACSKVFGERRYVSESQILAAMASVKVAGFEYVTYTLDDSYVLVRTCDAASHHGIVLVLARDEGNPALASLQLKKMCLEFLDAE